MPLFPPELDARIVPDPPVVPPVVPELLELLLELDPDPLLELLLDPDPLVGALV